MQIKTVLISTFIIFLSSIFYIQVRAQGADSEPPRYEKYTIEFVGCDSAILTTSEKKYKCKIADLHFVIENNNL